MRVHQDLVEEILERLPVKSLHRFKVVSKTWNSSIESQYFMKKHMIRRQLQEPDFLLVDDQVAGERMDDEDMTIRTLVLGSSDHEAELESTLQLQFTFNDVTRSCDGLVCIYHFRRSILMVNPSTKWMREVPLASLQRRTFRWRNSGDEPNLLGFGKDICTDTYKLVWLYASMEHLHTTCEVFDFVINSWRYVESPPYGLIDDHKPTYVDGSLHWFVCKESSEVRILSFDCHTEIFQEIAECPLGDQENETRFIMCNLNNRLCVSEKKWPTQDIWTLNCSDMMKWEKMYSLDLSSCPDGWLADGEWPIACPLAILNNKKLLIYDEHGPDGYNPNFVIYDMETRSYSLGFAAESVIFVTPYFQSLISISKGLWV
ncbi:unnamed protein product [Thlaspi arvense]|uniref:F-box domain-containing protein n=1 Tax=Thlaspi arvense TaxID=13288 RepID=A0AAU9R6V2_THLAR|nr:unnamed protein product [Thlaspi arvense]